MSHHIISEFVICLLLRYEHITLVNTIFVTSKLFSVSDIIFYTEFKYVLSFSITQGFRGTYNYNLKETYIYMLYQCVFTLLKK
jgi:hypothetical protein